MTPLITPSRKTGISKGEREDEQCPTRKASDASGVSIGERGPIDPRMPHLPPA
jgi:hypothetical protein